MVTLELQDKTSNDQRRNQRIVLRVGVTLSGTTPNGRPFHEAAYTLVVNAHGAFLPLESPVVHGQVLTMRHNKTEEELFCRVVRIDRGNTGHPQIAVEFIQPSPRFWRVTFPPVDWKPADPEAPQTRPARRVSPIVSQAA